MAESQKYHLWKMGSLEHRINPTQSAIKKLRTILEENQQEGEVHIIWGPDLDLITLNGDSEVEQIFDYDALPDKIETLKKKLAIYEELNEKHQKFLKEENK